MSFLKYFTLSYVIVFLLGVSCTVAMPGDNDEEEQSPRSSGESVTHTTPERAVVAAAVVEETPGLLLSRRQAVILRRQPFEKVVGSEKVIGWGLDWEAFQDISSPHTSEKLLNLHRLCAAMRKVEPEYRSNDNFQDLYDKVIGLRDRVERVHLERLEGVVGRYFSGVYPGCEVRFETKDLGVQLGTVAKIKDGEGRDHTFYVKTHSEGKLASQSSSAKEIDPKELLVYKTLERLGLGCEVHFCARSPEDVYIATRDASEGGRFFLFKRALEDEENLGNSLWSSLGNLDKCPWKSEEGIIELGLSGDEVAQSFASQISTLDILTRLLRLHDLLNNVENFGFVKNLSSGDNLLCLRVLDFRLLEDTNLRFLKDHFGGFLEGNGLFRYDLAHRTVSYLLHYRGEELRVQGAMVAMGGSLKDLETATSHAYEFVQTFIQKDSSFKEQRDVLLKRLESYHQQILSNCTFFRQSLQEYQPESH